jgi:tetratricopeptide (TPR) repeat protein
MELVKGIPITEYCDSRNLSTQARLKLFIDVCHAVQHAHHKGIIHRDLKPSNVLVTLHDDRPVPKVIDFGIAKATSQQLTERTLFTEYRQFIGTPEYMSPDQAEISGLDVDTRTDIYSLGVVLYELLTGTTPFDAQTLRTSGYEEIQRIIREVEPPLPSTRVGTMERSPSSGAKADGATSTKGSSIAVIAKHRQTEPDALRRSLRRDLDWIVMKAMEKDRTRRYESANEFANDIRRFLENQPVLASPPSLSYKLRKFVRRHRVAVGAGTLVAAALVFGLSLAAIGLVKASREARHSRAVSEYLQSLITQLEEEADRGSPLTLDEIVDRGRTLFGDDHALVGTVLMTRASSLRTVGRIDAAVAAQREALAQYREAHEGGHASIAAALTALGDLLEERRELTEAEATYREALAMREALFGDDSKLTADSLERLTSLIVESGNESRTDEIRQLWSRTLAAYEAALGVDHRTTVRQMCEYGTWLYLHGLQDESEEVLDRGLALARELLGKEDLMLFKTLNVKAQQLILQAQDFDGAIPIMEEMKEMSTRIWGRTFISTLSLLGQLPWLYARTGRDEQAAEAIVDFIEARRAAGPQPNIMIVAVEQQTWVAMADWFDQNAEVASEFVQFVIEDMREAVGAQSPQLASVLGKGTEWLVEQGLDEIAEPLLHERVAVLRQLPDTDPRVLAEALIFLGDLHVRQGDAEAAEALLGEALQLRADALPDESWLIGSAKASLGSCLTTLGRYQEAETLLLEGFQGVMRGEAPIGRREFARDKLVELYEAWNRPEEAERWKDPSIFLMLPARP